MQKSYHKSVQINYRFGLLPIEKEAHGVRFRTYEYLSDLSDDETLLRVLESLSNDDVFFDIGSNVGHYLLPILTKYPTINATGFEPSPRNYGRLTENLELNGLLDRATTNQIALSDESGTTEFFESSLHGISSFSREHASSGGANTNRVTVKVKTLDELIYDEHLTPPSCIKIDVEGHAVQVLRGGKQFFKDYGPSVFVECHGNMTEVMAVLESVGYDCEEETDQNAIYAE